MDVYGQPGKLTLVSASGVLTGISLSIGRSGMSTVINQAQVLPSGYLHRVQETGECPGKKTREGVWIETGEGRDHVVTYTARGWHQAAPRSPDWFCLPDQLVRAALQKSPTSKAFSRKGPSWVMHGTPDSWAQGESVPAHLSAPSYSNRKADSSPHRKSGSLQAPPLGNP